MVDKLMIEIKPSAMFVIGFTFFLFKHAPPHPMHSSVSPLQKTSNPLFGLNLTLQEPHGWLGGDNPKAQPENLILNLVARLGCAAAAANSLPS